MFSGKIKKITIFLLMSGVFDGAVFARPVSEIKRDILTTIGEKQNTSEGSTIFNDLMNEAMAAGMPISMFNVLKTRGVRVGFNFVEKDVLSEAKHRSIIEEEENVRAAEKEESKRRIAEEAEQRAREARELREKEEAQFYEAKEREERLRKEAGEAERNKRAAEDERRKEYDEAREAEKRVRDLKVAGPAPRGVVGRGVDPDLLQRANARERSAVLDVIKAYSKVGNAIEVRVWLGKAGEWFPNLLKRIYVVGVARLLRDHNFASSAETFEVLSDWLISKDLAKKIMVREALNAFIGNPEFDSLEDRELFTELVSKYS